MFRKVIEKTPSEQLHLLTLQVYAMAIHYFRDPTTNFQPTSEPLNSVSYTSPNFQADALVDNIRQDPESKDVIWYHYEKWQNLEERASRIAVQDNKNATSSGSDEWRDDIHAAIKRANVYFPLFVVIGKAENNGYYKLRQVPYPWLTCFQPQLRPLFSRVVGKKETINPFSAIYSYLVPGVYRFNANKDGCVPLVKHLIASLQYSRLLNSREHVRVSDGNFMDQFIEDQYPLPIEDERMQDVFFVQWTMEQHSTAYGLGAPVRGVMAVGWIDGQLTGFFSTISVDQNSNFSGTIARKNDQELYEYVATIFKTSSTRRNETRWEFHFSIYVSQMRWFTVSQIFEERFKNAITNSKRVNNDKTPLSDADFSAYDILGTWSIIPSRYDFMSLTTPSETREQANTYKRRALPLRTFNNAGVSIYEHTTMERQAASVCTIYSEVVSYLLMTKPQVNVDAINALRDINFYNGNLKVFIDEIIDTNKLPVRKELDMDRIFKEMVTGVIDAALSGKKEPITPENLVKCDMLIRTLIVLRQLGTENHQLIRQRDGTIYGEVYSNVENIAPLILKASRQYSPGARVEWVVKEDIVTVGSMGLGMSRPTIITVDTAVRKSDGRIDENTFKKINLLELDKLLLKSPNDKFRFSFESRLEIDYESRPEYNPEHGVHILTELASYMDTCPILFIDGIRMPCSIICSRGSAHSMCLFRGAGPTSRWHFFDSSPHASSYLPPMDSGYSLWMNFSTMADMNTFFIDYHGERNSMNASINLRPGDLKIAEDQMVNYAISGLAGLSDAAGIVASEDSLV